MEHRINVRVPKRLNVGLFFVGLDCGEFTASNVGHGGMFLDDCSQVLNEGDFVIVSLQEESVVKATTVSLRALVVHRSREGVGLMWTDSVDETYDLLDGIVSSAVRRLTEVRKLT